MDESRMLEYDWCGGYIMPKKLADIFVMNEQVTYAEDNENEYDIVDTVFEVDDDAESDQDEDDD